MGGEPSVFFNDADETINFFCDVEIPTFFRNMCKRVELNIRKPLISLHELIPMIRKNYIPAK